MPEEKAAVLGFAYGFRKDGVGMSNHDLINKLISQPWFFRLPLIMQDDLTLGLGKGRECGGNLVYIIKSHEGGKYVDTDTVAQRGIEAALEAGYTTLYILAYPLLHRQLCWFITRKLAKPYGIKVKIIKTGWIRSDPLSEQWWTRNHLYPFIYTALRVLFNRRGK